MKMRVTSHAGRTRTNGSGYDPDHVDRSNDKVKTADNINHGESEFVNWYWTYGDGDPGSGYNWYRRRKTLTENEQDLVIDGYMREEDILEDRPSFSEVERAFYDRFRKQHAAQCAVYEARGQGKRCRPFEEWIKAPQHVPEEVIMQIGRYEKTVDPDTFRACAMDYVSKSREWSREHGNPYTILDVGIHLDEAVPHMHIRQVWHSVDPDTEIDEIGQNKALERAGIPLPDPSAPRSRTNNRKQVYTAAMRSIWIDVCQAHGLDIESTPDPTAKHNRTKREYLDDAAKAAAEATRAAAKADAARIRQEATRDAAQTRKNAKQQADAQAKRICSKAEEEAKAILSDAKADAAETIRVAVVTAEADAARIRADAAVQLSDLASCISDYNREADEARKRLQREQDRRSRLDAREADLNIREAALTEWADKLREAGVSVPAGPKTAVDTLSRTASEKDAWEAKTDEEATVEGRRFLNGILSGLSGNRTLEQPNTKTGKTQQADRSDSPTL